MTDRQGWGPLTPGPGADILEVLAERRHRPTVIRFADGSAYITLDGSGWGRDVGDLWEHATADCQRLPDGESELLLFYLSDVVSLEDPDTGATLVSQTPAPGER